MLCLLNPSVEPVFLWEVYMTCQLRSASEATTESYHLQAVDKEIQLKQIAKLMNMNSNEDGHK